jgi:ADP-heptose:LPS heptosyltransferase
MDRIGDLVLTLPVDQALPDAHVDWWIPKGLSFVTDHAFPRRQAREQGREITFQEFRELLAMVREKRYEAAVIFQAPWWVSCLLWLARIPIRVGVKSKWHSFLFLNRAVRQKRSRSEASELEYNFRLAEAGLKKDLARHSLRLNASSREILNKFGLSQYFVVHPGMGGSALNWPTHHYESLIRALVERAEVVITGTKADEPYVQPLRDRLKDESRIKWLDQKLSGPELISVLAGARAIFAPSTGVLHLAASTGQRTVGVFSPVRVQQPKRWGPQGTNTATVMPQVQCPGELSCLGPACEKFNCMERITPSEALEKMLQ